MLPPEASRKRKEVEPLVKPKVAEADSVSSNRILAGYLAHEFFSYGTLFGQKYVPAQSEAVGMAYSQSTECKRMKSEEASANVKNENHSYADVANILKMDGAHLPGIVNPAQLARWMKMSVMNACISFQMLQLLHRHVL